MAIKINRNLPALRAQRLLGKTGSQLESVFERLSSGLRINKASDDAAGLSIADSLRADRRVYRQGIRNLNDGVSALNIVDGALDELSKIVVRLTELAEQSSNGVYTTEQRKALDQEAQALSREYNRIGRSTEFNGLALFNGGFDELSLQAGYGTSGVLSSSLGGKMGDGTFTLGADIPYTKVAVALGADSAAMDINGDGNVDMAVGTLSLGGATGISILLGDGTGNFSEIDYFEYATDALSAVNFGDFNGDGKVDLNVSFRNTTNQTFLGNGDGNFSPAIVNNFAAEHEVVGDFNGDGISDLATGTNLINEDLIVHFGGASNTLSQSVSLSVPASASMRDIDAFDYNGDGNLDIIASFFGGGPHFAVYEGDGKGGFVLGGSGSAFTGDHVTVGDFNNDGLDDFALGAAGVGAAFISHGDGTFSQSTVSGATLSSLAADFDGDGNLDLLSNGGALFHKGDGAGGFSAGVVSGFSVGSPDFVVADFNNDGVLDGLDNNVSSLTHYYQGGTRNGLSALLSFTLEQQFQALDALSEFTKVQSRLAQQRSVVGAFRSRIEAATNNLQVSAENFAAAESRIRDVDVAYESSQLVRLGILQQTGAAVLAQANLIPQLALTLLSV